MGMMNHLARRLEGSGRLWSLAVLIAAALAAVPAFSDDNPTLEKLRRQREEARRQVAARLEAAAAQRQNSSLRVFRDANGVPVITNRAERYQNRAGYIEEKIKYDPIVLPAKYRNLAKPEKYSVRQSPGGTAYLPSDIDYLVKYYAAQYALEPSLVYAVIRAESNFNPRAVSRAGARGLMQLMPGTAKEMGVTDSFDPAQNIAGGTQYLYRMLQLFDNDLQLALAAYNSGPETVRRHGGIPPIKETRDYVARVLKYSSTYVTTGVKAPALVASAPPAEPEAAPEECYTIHFKSGEQQYAERLIDADLYYYAEFEGRLFRIRKEHVAKVVEPA